MKHLPILLLFFCSLPVCRAEAAAPPPDLARAMADDYEFKRALQSWFEYHKDLGVSPDDEDWGAIVPTIYSLLKANERHFVALDDQKRVAAVAKLYGLFARKRRAARATVLFGPRRLVLMLLHADFASGHAKMPTAFGADSSLFKAGEKGSEAAEVKKDFLARIALVAAEGIPTTILVQTHGWRDRIAVDENTSITYAELAAAMMPAAKDANNGDLSQFACMFDSCYSADFADNLSAELRRLAKARRVALVPPAVIVASTSPNRVAWSDVFWAALTEYVVRQRPSLGAKKPVLTVDTVLHDVADYCRGSGRKLAGGASGRWETVNPARQQLPVILVPLSDDDGEQMRRILDLPDAASVPSFFRMDMP